MEVCSQKDRRPYLIVLATATESHSPLIVDVLLLQNKRAHTCYVLLLQKNPFLLKIDRQKVSFRYGGMQSVGWKILCISLPAINTPYPIIIDFVILPKKWKYFLVMFCPTKREKIHILHKIDRHRLFYRLVGM